MNLELSQELVSADGVVTLMIPAGWSAQSIFPATLVLTNDAALISSASTALSPAPGQTVVVLNAFPRASTDLAAGVTLAEIGGRMVSSTTGGGPDSLGAPRSFEVDGHPAVAFSGVTTVEGVQSGVYLLFVDLADAETFVNISASIAPGEQDSIGQLLESLIRTLVIDRSAEAAG